MLFYDGACRDAYVAAKSDFPYRPSALLVMDGLIRACVTVRSRIDSRLAENVRSATRLPIAQGEMRNTEAGEFLERLSGNSSVNGLDELISKLDGMPETIDELKARDDLLGSADRNSQRRSLTHQAERLGALRRHIKGILSAINGNTVSSLQSSYDDFNALQDAANATAESFQSEPLPGVGSNAWKALWDSARRLSREYAYPNRPFPVVEGESRCVLCQQTLEAAGRDRLSAFETFVREDTQKRLRVGKSKSHVQRGTRSSLSCEPGTRSALRSRGAMGRSFNRRQAPPGLRLAPRASPSSGSPATFKLGPMKSPSVILPLPPIHSIPENTVKKFAFLILGFLASGCFLVFLERPPTPRVRFSGDPVYCTGRSLLPVLEGARAAPYMTVGIVSYHDDLLIRDEQNGGMGIGLLWGSLLAYSVLKGAAKIRECREGKAEYVRERIRQQAALIAAEQDMVATQDRKSAPASSMISEQDEGLHPNTFQQRSMKWL